MEQRPEEYQERSMNRKGIILAGGSGTRLHPLTLSLSKQLLPVYDKPMIYYPLSVLMMAGIREILIITTPRDEPAFRDLLGDGSQWGISSTTPCSPSPADSPRPSSSAATSSAAAVLPDPRRQHLLRRRPESESLKAAARAQEGATVFGYWVKDPERYGVAEFDADGRVIGLEEKPDRPKIQLRGHRHLLLRRAGLRHGRRAAPSPRGELEITDLNRATWSRASCTWSASAAASPGSTPARTSP
jgi:glucose-1-phosphate thymidylyltransferase